MSLECEYELGRIDMQVATEKFQRRRSEKSLDVVRRKVREHSSQDPANAICDMFHP